LSWRAKARPPAQAGRPLLLVIAFVGDVFHEGAERLGAGDGALEVNTDARVRIIAPIFYESGTDTLSKHVSVRAAALQLVADAAIEIIAFARFAPEGQVSLGQRVIDKFCNRAMETLHHGAEVVADLQVAQRVVMIVHQRCHAWNETIFARPVLEAVPENVLGVFGFECRELVATPRGDEVNRVVAVPVFEAFASGVFRRPARELAESHQGNLSNGIRRSYLLKAGRPLKENK
jgi:hypothetical protein